MAGWKRGRLYQWKQRKTQERRYVNLTREIDAARRVEMQMYIDRGAEKERLRERKRGKESERQAECGTERPSKVAEREAEREAGRS